MSYEPLLEIQRLDIETERLNHRRVNLDERAALEQAAAEQAKQQREIDIVAAARVEVATRQRRFEDEAQIVAGKADVDEARLYSGEIQGMKDLEALQHEIGGLRARQGSLEDEALEAMEEAEGLSAQVTALDAARADVDRRIDELTTAIVTAETEIDAEVEALSAARTAAVESLDASVVLEYERLRPGFGAATVVRFTGSNCDGCPSVMPAMEVDRMKREDSESLQSCDECGRMVLR